MQYERLGLISEAPPPTLRQGSWTPCVTSLLCIITISVVALFAAYDIVLVTNYLANNRTPRSALVNATTHLHAARDAARLLKNHRNTSLLVHK